MSKAKSRSRLLRHGCSSDTPPPGRTGSLERFRHAPNMVQVLVLTGLLICGVASSFVEPRSSSMTLPIDLPVAEQPSITWHQEVGDFADRLIGSFHLRRDVADKYAEWILEASARSNIEPDLIASVVAAESDFRFNVVSPMGAVGPTQVQPELWANFCFSLEISDPEDNVSCGALILSYLRERCGGETCALKAYNLGFGNINSAIYVHAARRYLNKVDNMRLMLEKQGVSPVTSV